MPLTVGTPSAGYAYRRNIIDVVPNTRYRMVVDANRMLTGTAKLLSSIVSRPPFELTSLRNTVLPIGAHRVDVLHFFNAVNRRNTPWITTFETVVPRFTATIDCHHGPDPTYETLQADGLVRSAIDHLARDSCKQLIALSCCAANLQREMLGVFPELKTAVLDKLTVLYPPQRAVIDDVQLKATGRNGAVTFMLVGHQFFSKGGRETVAVLSRVRTEHGYPIRLEIVSNLTPDNYASHTGAEDVALARASIARHSDWIEYYPSLPNSVVIEHMRRAHIGLLPTYAETFGYSVLEFQAAGCPVISTNVRALPEINSEECGWLISVPRNRLGEAMYTTPDARQNLSTAIEAGLERAVHEIFSNRSRIEVKGAAALSRIEKAHSPDDFARQMQRIYSQACSQS